jgi:aldose 1-epimerase
MQAWKNRAFRSSRQRRQSQIMAREIIALTDPGTGATARLLPSVGCNCFQFRVPTSAGACDLLWSEPGFDEGNKRASGSGIPVLFPFPGRLQGTALRWHERDWPLEAGDGLGNAIHGFVHERPWRVLELATHRLVAEFQASRDDPQLLRRWPADFRVTAVYELHGRQMEATYRIDNPDSHALPCGFGTHPYFRLPLGGSSAAACCVRLPVRSRWELSAMIPTGRKVPVSDAAEFQQGQLFADMQYDDVFSDLVTTGGPYEATIEDPQSLRRVSFTFDSAFRECVVYTPPHREAICIEPYTMVPDAFQLEQRGIMAGARVLAPGQSFQARLAIALQ